MAKLGSVLGHLRRLFHQDATSSDWELLRRFAEDKDEAAFSALIGRYGQLVLGIANRILQNEHDAEDVFQAVFGVLARKAGTVDRRAALSTWLHTVAFNLAVSVKKRSTMRREREQEAASMTEPQTNTAAWEEIRPLLDAELERLPAQYRVPLTLTYLMGKTTEEAAQEIGCSPDAVRGRLARGRDLLRNRLVKKGVTISSALLTTALAENAASASVSVACAASALQVALVVAGRGTGVLSPTVSALIQEGVSQMFMSKVKLVAVVLVAVLVLAAGAGFVAQKVLAAKQEVAKNDSADDKEKSDKKETPKEKRDTEKVVPILGRMQGYHAPYASVIRTEDDLVRAVVGEDFLKNAGGDWLKQNRKKYADGLAQALPTLDFKKNMLVNVQAGAGRKGKLTVTRVTVDSERTTMRVYYAVEGFVPFREAPQFPTVGDEGSGVELREIILVEQFPGKVEIVPETAQTPLPQQR